MVAALLEKNGYSVKILDLPALGLSENFLPPILHQEKPNVVGITAMTPTINSALKVARKVKETNSDIFVILGGAHATLLPEETLRSALEIDFIVRGEGEQTTLELVKAVDENPREISQVLGITYREGLSVKSNPLRPPISDLDDLPFPAFHLLPMGKYRLHPPFGRRPRVMPIITSRGCPFRCVFCSKAVFGKKYRSNSHAYIVDEIRYLNEKFGVKEIKFYDDVFTLDRERVIAICMKLKEQGMDIPWSCETRVDLVDSELLKVMKNAGCYMIEYGVESGDQGILNSLKKDITLEKSIEAFKLTHEAGIGTAAYFMVGSPQETPGTIKETIEFAKKLDPDFVQFSIATPYPGTELYGLVSEDRHVPEKWEEYKYDAHPKAVGNPSFGSETLSIEELRKWREKAYISFYLRWGYVWKRLRKMTSVGDFRTNISGLRMLIDLTR
jgi:radical SAM superfamily enzyme YgiQ (UPF0313 family)